MHQSDYVILLLAKERQKELIAEADRFRATHTTWKNRRLRKTSGAEIFPNLLTKMVYTLRGLFVPKRKPSAKPSEGIPRGSIYCDSRMVTRRGDVH